MVYTRSIKRRRRNRFEIVKGRLDTLERGQLQLDSPGLIAFADYDQESGKEWVPFRFFFRKYFACPANVPGQTLSRAEFLRDNLVSCTSIHEINKINIDALEDL